MGEAPRYQDFVIKDGRLVGDFDGLYANFDDPWHQSSPASILNTRRRVVLDQCSRLRDAAPRGAVSRVLDVGCGFGFLTDELRRAGFAAVGVDGSLEAIRQARHMNSASIYLQRRFEDPTLLTDLDPDVVILAEVTWHVLDHLDEFLERIRGFASNRQRPTYLIHLLETYAPGQQIYGRDFFTDLEGILSYFGMTYLETGVVMEPSRDQPEARGTYFVAQVMGGGSMGEKARQ